MEVGAACPAQLMAFGKFWLGNTGGGARMDIPLSEQNVTKTVPRLFRKSHMGKGYVNYERRI